MLEKQVGSRGGAALKRGTQQGCLLHCSADTEGGLLWDVRETSGVKGGCSFEEGHTTRLLAPLFC